MKDIDYAQLAETTSNLDIIALLLIFGFFALVAIGVFVLQKIQEKSENKMMDEFYPDCDDFVEFDAKVDETVARVRAEDDDWDENIPTLTDNVNESEID